MSILDWFSENNNKAKVAKKLDIPEDVWVKCSSCNATLYLKDLEANFKVCLECNYHFRVSSEERISQIFDKNSFKEIVVPIEPIDFLNFVDTEKYSVRLEKARTKTKKKEAVIIGEGLINGQQVNAGIMDFSFMGGSMGSVVGEKLTLIIEKAIENKNPVIIFTSSGGARMQEGIMSLMQMAKTSGALYRLGKVFVPYISVLCDPTTGGTSASFAMLGDIILAEPGALISFAGPRVIEQTIRQKLPKGFQRSEFLLEHGMLDKIVHRKDMKFTLSSIIGLLNPHPQKKS
ncbi:acetyl-CoA carboxylase carboxyltransferase subunit beta [bacterium]|jgi:acetyl-CoA carboxylase carboxyl transferase subunit beta|nr:acetyl-CoA carboxylase carboxyltransferase subunit beta [bacterium]